MLRWAIKAKKDTRNSLLYLASNVPTAQILAFKRIYRYLSKLDQHDRFVADVRFSVQHTARKRVGVNLFHFWDDVLAKNIINDSQIEGVSDFYELFKRQLAADLATSARISRNGLDTLVVDMI